MCAISIAVWCWSHLGFSLNMWLFPCELIVVNLSKYWPLLLLATFLLCDSCLLGGGFTLYRCCWNFSHKLLLFIISHSFSHVNLSWNRGLVITGVSLLANHRPSSKVVSELHTINSTEWKSLCIRPQMVIKICMYLMGNMDSLTLLYFIRETWCKFLAF